MEIQRSDQKLWPFRTGTLVSSDDTSASSSSDSTSTTRKTASRNSCKIWGRSNGRIKSYGPFEPVLWSRATIPPHHRVAIPHLLLGKQRPETPVKFWGRSNNRIKSFGPLEPVLWSRATIPPHHRVAIPHLLLEKHCPETPVKIWWRSNGRIKSMGLSNRYCGLEGRYLRMTE